MAANVASSPPQQPDSGAFQAIAGGATVREMALALVDFESQEEVGGNGEATDETNHGPSGVDLLFASMGVETAGLQQGLNRLLANLDQVRYQVSQTMGQPEYVACILAVAVAISSYELTRRCAITRSKPTPLPRPKHLGIA